MPGARRLVRLSEMRSLLLFTLLTLPLIARADQVRVFDNSSLLRASAECRSSCVISVELSEASAEPIVLNNTDGVQADLSSASVERKLRFGPLTSGSWRIQAPPHIRVLTVAVDPSN